MSKIIVSILVAGSLVAGTAVGAKQTKKTAMPHIIVYKTKKNYRDHVPVILSDDRLSVVSFPGPGDLVVNGKPALPVKLHHGYLLDRRGVGSHTGFLKLTYGQYSKLNDVPTPAALYKMVIDKNPMTELYDCGVNEGDNGSAAVLNKLIDGGQLKKKCKAIK
jgi:hypothetical protein